MIQFFCTKKVGQLSIWGRIKYVHIQLIFDLDIGFMNSPRWAGNTKIDEQDSEKPGFA